MAVHTLKPREVAERLSVSIDTVYRLIAAGELPAAKIGTFLRIPEAELDAWILRHRVSGTGELPPEITEGQRRALHAKANQLDRRDTVEYGHWKRAVLKAASEH